MSRFQWGKLMATKFARSQTIGLSYVGPMLGHYQKYTWPKSSNIAELKIALLPIWNDLLQEFIGKAIPLFRQRFRSYVAAAGGHF